MDSFLVQIFGDKDMDGFYMGEAGGHRGLVPCNMISEVQVDDPDIAAQLLRESNRSAAGSRATSEGLRSANRTPGTASSSRGPTPRRKEPYDPSGKGPGYGEKCNLFNL